MVKLKRHWRLNKDNKMYHLGPCPGGWFFAHAVHNDLPADRERTSVHDLAWMLDHGRVWLSNAEAEDEAREWVEVHSVEDLPVFRGVVHENYDSCTSTYSVCPYMPEFYWLPSDEGSRKALKKDAQRQYIPEYLKFREWDKKRRRFHEISWRRLYY
jgi:hypothetical protein